MTGFRLDAKWTSRGWRCPTDEKLAAYVEQRIAAHERERVEAHLTACRACRNQVGFLVRTEDEREIPVVPVDWVVQARELNKQDAGLGRAGWSPGWVWGATAAAACLLLAALWLRPQQESAPPASVAPSFPAPPLVAQAESKPLPPSRPSPAVRNHTRAALAPVVLFPQPHSRVALEGLEFRWREVKGALSYEVRLVNAEGDVLWEQRVPGRSVKPPAGLSLRPGESCFVWVGADLPDGTTVQSRAVPFTIADEK